MAFDYNKLTFGEKGKTINVVVEIPKGSNLKVEWRRKKNIFELDRIEPEIFSKPCNYGFIPGTLDDDNDELDVLLVNNEPIPMGLVVIAKVIGVVNFSDDNEIDHKIIAVPEDDRNGRSLNSYKDLGENWEKQIEYHFNHYKDLKKPGSTLVQGFGDSKDAWKVIEECIQRFEGQIK
ncbi:inorganic diphosphatase [Candidatus Woesebacteria bacterium]|nr:inorganic diphosphatase [Candidatus Woesebacteria bacterium]